MLFSLTNEYFHILAHSQTTTMILIITRKDTNDITTTARHFLFDLNNTYYLVTFTICVNLSQTTTTMAVPASINRSDYECGLIDIFSFDQFLSNYLGESGIASDSESAQQRGDFSDTQSGSQLVTTNSDYNECLLLTAYDETTISESTTVMITAKHAKCYGGNEPCDLNILKTFLRRLLDILKECLFVENGLLFLSNTSFFIWQRLFILASAIGTVSSSSQLLQQAKQREKIEMPLVIAPNTGLHNMTALIETVAIGESCTFYGDWDWDRCEAMMNHHDHVVFLMKHIVKHHRQQQIVTIMNAY